MNVRQMVGMGDSTLPQIRDDGSLGVAKPGDYFCVRMDDKTKRVVPQGWVGGIGKNGPLSSRR